MVCLSINRNDVKSVVWYILYILRGTSSIIPEAESYPDGNLKWNRARPKLLCRISLFYTSASIGVIFLISLMIITSLSTHTMQAPNTISNRSQQKSKWQHSNHLIGWNDDNITESDYPCKMQNPNWSTDAAGLGVIVPKELSLAALPFFLCFFWC